MEPVVTDVLWAVFGLAVIAGSLAVIRWRHELHESGWWTGIAVEGRTVEVGVNQGLCMGASSCVELAPDVFHLDWSKRKSSFDPAPLESERGTTADPETVFRAAQSCPYRAIYLRDATSGDSIFP